MTVIRKAVAEDFEKVYPLLCEFKNPYIKKEDWQRVFLNIWQAPEKYCGYILLEDDQVVGFLGLLFSRRKIRGKTHALCNLTSWIVKEEFRGKSLFLLLPVLKLRSHTIVDLTPSHEVRALLDRANFKVFETHYRLVFPTPLFFFVKPCNYSLTTNQRFIENTLESNQWKIYRDHHLPNCLHFIICNRSENCYVVASRMVRHKFPFYILNVHYISNYDVFLNFIKRYRNLLFFKLRVFAVFLDERFIKDVKLFFSKKCKLTEPRLFKSDQLKCEDMDTLYSESIVLNI